MNHRKYDDPEMDEYFTSLPPEVQAYVERSQVEISTYGELMQIGEHFKSSIGEDETDLI